MLIVNYFLLAHLNWNIKHPFSKAFIGLIISKHNFSKMQLHSVTALQHAKAIILEWLRCKACSFVIFCTTHIQTILVCSQVRRTFIAHINSCTAISPPVWNYTKVWRTLCVKILFIIIFLKLRRASTAVNKQGIVYICKEECVIKYICHGNYRLNHMIIATHKSTIWHVVMLTFGFFRARKILLQTPRNSTSWKLIFS